MLETKYSISVNVLYFTLLTLDHHVHIIDRNICKMTLVTSFDLRNDIGNFLEIVYKILSHLYFFIFLSWGVYNVL